MTAPRTQNQESAGRSTDDVSKEASATCTRLNRLSDELLDALQEAGRPSSRRRRLAAEAVVLLLVVDLWVIAGKPWWPPLALVAGAVLVSLLRRVLPRGLRY